MAMSFVDRLRSGPMSLYIPTHTVLFDEYEKPLEDHISEWVINHPDAYQDALRRSFEAGCDCCHTATQASNAIRAATFGDDYVARIFEFNLKCAKLAREATPEGKYVLGNITSTNPDFVEPLGSIKREYIPEAYKPQILALAEGGVDAFHVAGNQIDVTLTMLELIRELTDIPVLCVNAFYSGKAGFRTLYGETPEQACAKVDATGVPIAIGATCGEWVYSQGAELVGGIRKGTDKYPILQPDAGMPELIDGKTVHPETPDKLEAELPNWLDAGAWVVGGCCGTTIEHYRRIAKVLAARRDS